MQPSRARIVALSAVAALAAMLGLAMILLVSRNDAPHEKLARLPWQPLPPLSPVGALSSSATDSERVELRVRADAPVAEIRIAGVVHTVDPPKKSFALPIERPKDKPLKLEAQSADGATSSLELSPDSNLARFKFPAPPKESGKKRPSLLPSPYDR